jgi:hypothetical protein
MNRAKQITTLVLLTALAATQIFANRLIDCMTPVEVTEIKNLGISDSDETKSVIEIKWQINPTLHPNHSQFNVSLEIIYANGMVLIVDEQSENSTRSVQIEVPTVNLRRGKSPAFIRQIKAFVTTELLSQRGTEK